MTEIRELLRTAIGDRRPAIPDLELVVRRGAARRRRARVLAAVVALALTAGLGTGLALALHGGGAGGPAQGTNVVGPTREIFIPSVSMEPTLKEGDTVLVDEGAYVLEAGLPSPGDIIAFDVPGEAMTFVKRVVGLPGDAVEERDGLLYLNGQEFPMPASPVPDRRTMGPWTVEPGRVFVVGDNLSNSNDSRFSELGQIPVGQIIGKVVEILSPGDRRATVGPPPAQSASGPGTATPSEG
ncbi:MAG: signal peptidase I [Actinomycetota bacterium]